MSHIRAKYVLGLFAITIAGVCHADWQYPHGDSANTGFANTVTPPARSAIRVAQVGELVAGACPVVGSDGTVYIGDLSGSVLAFRADGTFVVEPAIARGAVDHVLARYWRRRFGLRGSGSPFPCRRNQMIVLLKASQ